MLEAAPHVATITRRGDEACAEPDGCVGAGGRVWGCYLHGLFAEAASRRGWLASLGWQPQASPAVPDPYERRADHVEGALQSRALAALLNPA